MTLKAWLARRHLMHAGVSKFRQDGSYRKKDKDHVKDDWRERKGFAKDQSKHRTWCKCRRYLKDRGNREERRWVRKMIHHERFDEIYHHQDMFVSSWDAC
jgi:hypothetical protein